MPGRVLRLRARGAARRPLPTARRCPPHAWVITGVEIDGRPALHYACPLCDAQRDVTGGAALRAGALLA